MKNQLWKMIAGLSLTILIVAAFGQVWVSAQAENGRGLVGSWDVTVTPRDCATGNTLPFPPSFSGMQTYNLGGTMIESDPVNVGSSPTTHIGGQGVWSHSGGREYTLAFRVAEFNPDGSYAGKSVIRDVILLGRDGNTYTSAGSVEIYNAAGILVFTGCATTAATRFE